MSEGGAQRISRSLSEQKPGNSGKYHRFRNGMGFPTCQSRDTTAQGDGSLWSVYFKNARQSQLRPHAILCLEQVTDGPTGRNRKAGIRIQLVIIEVAFHRK